MEPWKMIDFFWNWPFDSCKIAEGLKKKKKKKKNVVKHFFLSDCPGPPWRKFLDPRMQFKTLAGTWDIGHFCTCVKFFAFHEYCTIRSGYQTVWLQIRPDLGSSCFRLHKQTNKAYTKLSNERECLQCFVSSSSDGSEETVWLRRLVWSCVVVHTMKTKSLFAGSFFL